MSVNQNYGVPFGLSSNFAFAPVISNRAPIAQDIGYHLGQEWIDEVANNVYVLAGFSGGLAVWNLMGTSTGPLNTLQGGSGGAISPVAGNIILAGTANQIATAGAGHTITFSLVGPYTPATYTAHGVLIGEGASSVVATTAGATGDVLIGATGADPAFGALGVNSGLTAHGVLLGENNSAIVATAAGTTGEVLIGSTGSDPAFGALGVNSGLTAHGVLLGENNSAIAATAALSNGELLIGSTGSDPVPAHLTPGNGIQTAEGAGTLSVSVIKGGFTPNSIAGASSPLLAQNSYIANDAAQTTFTLPATASVGETFLITGGAGNTGGIVIAQNGGQTIRQGANVTTTGATGTVTSPGNANSVIALMCVATNNDFVVLYTNDTWILA